MKRLLLLQGPARPIMEDGRDTFAWRLTTGPRLRWFPERGGPILPALLPALLPNLLPTLGDGPVTETKKPGAAAPGSKKGAF